MPGFFLPEYLYLLSRPEISCHLEDLFMNQSIPKRKRRSQRDYTIGFKLSVVERVEKGEMTYKQAQTTYGIQGRSTVLVWLRKHGKLDWTQASDRPMSIKNETPEPTIKRLQKELEDEGLRNLILDGMVDIMDKQYGASLRKKYLSKELKRLNLKAK